MGGIIFPLREKFGISPEPSLPIPKYLSRYLGMNFRTLCNSSSDLFQKLERSKISKISSPILASCILVRRDQLNENYYRPSIVSSTLDTVGRIGCRFDSMVHHSEMSEARQVTVCSHQFGDTVALHSSSPKLLRNNGRNEAVNNMETLAGIRGEGRGLEHDSEIRRNKSIRRGERGRERER